MKRVYTFCGIGGLVALLAVTAVCQGFQSSQSISETAHAFPAMKQAAPNPGSRPATVSSPASQANVYELLEKLEALKVKQNAIESEMRETRALLNERFRTLQERVGRVSVPVMPLVPPVGTYGFSIEPVTAPAVCQPSLSPTGTGLSSAGTQRVEAPAPNTPATAPTPSPIPDKRRDSQVEPKMQVPTRTSIPTGHKKAAPVPHLPGDPSS